MAPPSNPPGRPWLCRCCGFAFPGSTPVGHRSLVPRWGPNRAHHSAPRHESEALLKLQDGPLCSELLGCLRGLDDLPLQVELIHTARIPTDSGLTHLLPCNSARGRESGSCPAHSQPNVFSQQHCPRSAILASCCTQMLFLYLGSILFLDMTTAENPPAASSANGRNLHWGPLESVVPLQSPWSPSVLRGLAARPAPNPLGFAWTMTPRRRTSTVLPRLCWTCVPKPS
mmetsp:Transcript_31742/g.68268  ORF Transcript_31742/g.68268 Transcript_31742/m.68268 type:complete len:228 (+) Transcript_31742:1857-2540(+)